MGITDNTANEILQKLNLIIQSGLLDNLPKAKPCPYTLRQWLDIYLNVYKENKIKPLTLKDYTQAIRTYIPNNLLDRNLNDIKVFELQGLINDVAQSHSRRARTIYDIFNGAFREAFNNDVLQKDLTKALKKPFHESEEETPLTQEQQQQIFNMPASPFKDILVAYIWTGCRFAELVTLKPDYFDKANNRLFINGTKTKTSKRFVPVFAPVAEILERLPAGQAKIFKMSPKTMRRHKAAVEKLLGFEFTFKALRHTFNQNLMELGVPDIVRAAWMGHSKPTTTKKTYTHMTTKLQQDAIAQIENYLKT